MRLSARRRRRWDLDREGAGAERTELAFTRSGVVDVVRMGEGEPLVLVPGLAGGWRMLVPLARALSRQHEVFLYSLDGERRTLGGRFPRTVADHARDLGDLLNVLRLERPTVFGVSFGGAIALELATAEPQRLGSLVLSGAAASYPLGLGAKVALKALEKFALPSNSPFLNQFFNLLHGQRPDDPDLASFVAERLWETDQGVVAGRIRSLEAYDVAERLWRIAAPTLVLAGSRDVVVPPARQRALADAIPGARFETIAGAGHIGFLTHTADVSHQVRRLARASQAAML
jgi:3-oxoadipate enol-lactonase